MRIHDCVQKTQKIVTFVFLFSIILLFAQSDNHQCQQIVIFFLGDAVSDVFRVRHLIKGYAVLLAFWDIVQTNPYTVTFFQLSIICTVRDKRQLGGQLPRQIIHSPLLNRIAGIVGLLRFYVYVEFNDDVFL